MSTLQDKLKGNWNLIKGNLKQKWSQLTDDELLYEEGKEDELIGRIQKKTGETKEAINAYLEKMKFD
ncbi:MAG TPA: CsbD family protein [Niabella sp.]